MTLALTLAFELICEKNKCRRRAVFDIFFNCVFDVSAEVLVWLVESLVCVFAWLKFSDNLLGGGDGWLFGELSSIDASLLVSPTIN